MRDREREREREREGDAHRCDACSGAMLLPFAFVPRNRQGELEGRGGRQEDREKEMLERDRGTATF